MHARVGVGVAIRAFLFLWVAGVVGIVAVTRVPPELFIGFVVVVIAVHAFILGRNAHAASEALSDACEAGRRAAGQGAYRTARVRVETPKKEVDEHALPAEPRARKKDTWDASEL